MSGKSFDVYVAASTLWQPILNKVLDGVRDPRVKALTHSLIITMHSQHVGITPTLALGLAYSFLGEGNNPDRSAPWHLIPIRLREALRKQADGIDIKITETADVVFRTSSAYIVYHVVIPLIDHVCRDYVLYTVLFSEDSNVRPSVKQRDYVDYERRLTAGLSTLLSTDSIEMLEMFWVDRALTVYSVPERQLEGNVNKYPDFTLPDLQVFLSLHPKTTRVQHWQRRQIQVVEPTHLRDDRQHDAGFDGIKMTTNLDKLHHMLMSEYSYPPIIRLDRLVNSGYMVLQPPPQPMKLRDVLIVVLMPELFVDGIVQIFLKTTWFFFSIYLSSILRTNHLSQSELRWIEGDSLQRMRFQNLLLKRLRGLRPVSGPTIAASYRQLYLRAMGWLPTYLDKHASFQRLGEQEETDNVQEWWIREAWRNQLDDEQWHESEHLSRYTMPYERKILATDAFRYVHVMLFLPSNKWPSDGKRLHMGRFFDASVRYSVTWVPKTLDDFDAWGYEGRSRLQLVDNKRREQDKREISTEDLSGALIDAWLDGIMKEMQNE